jgi:putative flippase GtrA
MRNIHRHIGQFSLYVLSGGTAAIVDFGSYAIMIRVGVWYIAASVISSTLGFFTTFLLNKYVVFMRREEFLKHLSRFFIVDVLNTVASTLVLYGLVDGLGVEKQIAKIIAMGMVVLWNFFIYKFLVYV